MHFTPPNKPCLILGPKVQNRLLKGQKDTKKEVWPTSKANWVGLSSQWVEHKGREYTSVWIKGPLFLGHSYLGGPFLPPGPMSLCGPSTSSSFLG